MKKLFAAIVLSIFVGPVSAYEKLDKGTTVNSLMNDGYTLEFVTTYTDLGIAYTLRSKQTTDYVTCVIRTIMKSGGAPKTICFRP